jgi:hypothetical protein
VIGCRDASGQDDCTSQSAGQGSPVRIADCRSQCLDQRVNDVAVNAVDTLAVVGHGTGRLGVQGAEREEPP